MANAGGQPSSGFNELPGSVEMVTAGQVDTADWQTRQGYTVGRSSSMSGLLSRTHRVPFKT